LDLGILLIIQKKKIKLINNKLNSVEEQVDYCLIISNDILNNKNNYNGPGTSFNHVKYKIKISADTYKISSIFKR